MTVGPSAWSKVDAVLEAIYDKAEEIIIETCDGIEVSFVI